MTIVLFLTRTLCTFIGGLILALGIIQEDPWFLRTVEQLIAQNFSKTFECSMQCHVKAINFFILSIDLENISVSHAQKGLSPWYWSCKKCSIATSWSSFCIHKKFATTIIAKKFLLQSSVQNSTLAIMPHLTKIIMEPSVLPIDMQRIQVFNGTIIAEGAKPHEFAANIQWHADIALMQKRTKVACSLTDASIVYNNNYLLKALSGKLTTTSRVLAASAIGSKLGNKNSASAGSETGLLIEPDKPSDTHDVQVWAGMQTLLPWVTENNGIVECSAQCRNNAGRFEMHNEDYAFNLEIIPIQECLMAQVSGNFPLPHIARALNYPFANDCKGMIDLTCSVDLYDPWTSCRGVLRLSDIGYKNYTIAACEALWHGQHDRISGSATCTVNSEIAFQGTAQYTFNANNLEAMITNATRCSYASYCIAPNTLLITGSMRDWHNLEGSFSCTALDTITHEPKMALSMLLTGTLDNARLEGSYNTDLFDGNMCCKPPYTMRCVYKTAREELAQLDYKNSTLEFIARNQLLQRVMHKVMGRNFIGTGDLAFTFKQRGDPWDAANSESIIEGTCTLKGGMIRLSPLYNILKELQANFSFDYKKKLFCIDQLHMGLHRGTIAVQDAKIFFDENLQCATAYVPLSLTSCFLSWHKDIFALLSGNVVLAYTSESAMIQGECIIERSHIKGTNIGFDSGQQGSAAILPTFAQRCGINMHIASQRPIEVQTSFLEATAALDCTFTGTLEEPNLGGSVDISHGKLNFPYKPLYITRSNIYFLPQELDNPSISLQAKNSIKQFEIMLNVTGTLKKPTITFSSSPSLTEEQIITLLFTGSEEAALSAVLQTMLVQNIQNIILGPPDQTSPVQKYLKHLLKPLKNIRVVPSFSDETGRAGLRAAIEIEVNDRLRGSLQKNFSLPEDIRIEVDYALSDEVTIKGIRNERGNMGAEMEMRFKF